MKLWRHQLRDLKDRKISLKCVKRSANKVAHYLARFTFYIVDPVWRVDNAHSKVIDVMSKVMKVQ